MGLRDTRIDPPFLKKKWGQRFMYSFRVMADGVVSWSFQGAVAGFPTLAPPDAMPAIGRDKQIIRGFDETDFAYGRRLQKSWDAHAVQGNPFELLREIRGYLGTHDVRVRTVDNRGTWCTIDVGGAESILRAQNNWNWDNHPPPAWSRFWVIIYPSTSGLWTEDGDYDGGEVWGTGLNGTIGTSATSEQVHSIREICREWRPEGTTCVNIIVAFDDASFDPTGPAGPPLPDGSWGSWGKPDGSGVIRSARLSTARYWDGTSNVESLVVRGG